MGNQLNLLVGTIPDEECRNAMLQASCVSEYLPCVEIAPGKETHLLPSLSSCYALFGTDSGEEGVCQMVRSTLKAVMHNPNFFLSVLCNNNFTDGMALNFDIGYAGSPVFTNDMVSSSEPVHSTYQDADGQKYKTPTFNLGSGEVDLSELLASSKCMEPRGKRPLRQGELSPLVYLFPCHK